MRMRIVNQNMREYIKRFPNKYTLGAAAIRVQIAKNDYGPKSPEYKNAIAAYCDHCIKKAVEKARIKFVKK